MSDTATAPPRRGYNADEKAREREGAPVTIAGEEYHPRRKTTAVMREVRRIGREQNRVNRESRRLTRELEALELEAPDEQRDELEERIDALGDEANALTFRMLAALLVHSDGGEAQPETLEMELDVADAGGLSDYLLEGVGEEPDPTPPTATTGD